MIEARQPLHLAMRAGTVMSILGTATGRAFAAAMPPERITKALAAPLGEPPESRPPLLRGRSTELRAITAEVRKHGVARAVGRPVPGVNAFSAAAFDHEGEPAIVITLLGHQDELSSNLKSKPAVAVRNAAAEISHRLGWRKPV